MKILIHGLPESGKTTLAWRLKRALGPNAQWYNSDDIRTRANDWDFSYEGRLRQTIRMKDYLDAAAPDEIVIVDYICPLNEFRDMFSPDVFKVFCDTVADCEFEDTNQMFERPLNLHVDYIIWRWDDQSTDIMIEEIIKGALSQQYDGMSMWERTTYWLKSHIELNWDI